MIRFRAVLFCLGSTLASPRACSIFNISGSNGSPPLQWGVVQSFAISTTFMAFPSSSIESRIRFFIPCKYLDKRCGRNFVSFTKSGSYLRHDWCIGRNVREGQNWIQQSSACDHRDQKVLQSLAALLRYPEGCHVPSLGNCTCNPLY
jgi:hypothetical protein